MWETTNNNHHKYITLVEERDGGNDANASRRCSISVSRPNIDNLDTRSQQKTKHETWTATIPPLIPQPPPTLRYPRQKSPREREKERTACVLSTEYYSYKVVLK